jgi:hypothetical protein
MSQDPKVAELRHFHARRIGRPAGGELTRDAISPDEYASSPY